MSKDDHYLGALLEEIDSKFDRIIEVVGALSDEMKTKADKSDVQDIRDDIRIIKAVVTDQSHHVNDLDERVTKLEARKI